MIGDPCYLNGDNDEHNPLKDWSAFCDQIQADGIDAGFAPLKWKNGSNLGTVIGNFGGDWTYNVYACFAKDGSVRAAMVVFDGEEDETDGESETDDEEVCDDCGYADGLHASSCDLPVDEDYDHYYRDDADATAADEEAARHDPALDSERANT